MIATATKQEKIDVNEYVKLIATRKDLCMDDALIEMDKIIAKAKKGKPEGYEFRLGLGLRSYFEDNITNRYKGRTHQKPERIHRIKE